MPMGGKNKKRQQIAKMYYKRGQRTEGNANGGKNKKRQQIAKMYYKRGQRTEGNANGGKE